MLSRYSVVTPAQDVSLVTLYEAKLALGIPQATATNDDQIELMIKWSSAEIAAICNRVFAREKVVETFNLGNYAERLYLSHYPVVKIDSVTDGGETVANTDYNIDLNTGTLSTDIWEGPVIVTYTGGYDLPYDAPPALAQAALLLTKETYYAAVRGDASVRSVSHKESRVMYFDPNQQSRQMGSGGSGAAPGAGSGSSPAHRAINDLVRHFMRFEI